VSDLASHLIVVWRFRTPDDSAPVRAAEDDLHRVIVFAVPDHAASFAARLRGLGLDAEPYPVDGSMVAELLGHNCADPSEEDVTLFEASTVSAEDAARWAVDLADRMFVALARAFNEAVPEDNES
jgi:hypothetical protein